MAAPSGSSTRCTRNFDVFLSFRGLDTRYGFTDHLYMALVDAGFHTFRDDELPRGENIDPELCRAIYDSKCSVIIFSENYGDSESCLFELVTILEHRRTSDHVVLPVFYNIDPDNVRNQTGSFAKAFARHEEQFKADTNKVQFWRKALEEAANLAGMSLQNQADKHEAKFIKNIVDEVENKIKGSVLLNNNVTPLVGLKSPLRAINSWVRDGSKEVGILLICGTPGMGKTTIAQSVYKSNFKRFTQSSFLENISSEMTSQPNGLIHLQSKILQNLTRREVKIDNVSEGTSRIRCVIGSKRVLLVLDDVDQMNQIEKTIGMRDWFYPGSKIIITTTREGAELLNAREVCRVHVIEPLNWFESLELFSWHAFGQSHPFKSYKELSERVVRYCGGHPLALKVLGRSLSWINKDDWVNEVKRFEDNPDPEIHEKLKLSYYTLRSDLDKKLFLDIACFFIGANKDFVVTILDEGDFPAKSILRSLINRCLITIDDNNKVRMHNLLCDMGREIVRQASPHELGKRTRLWNDKDSYEVLTEMKGENTIEGIVLNKSNISSNEVVIGTNAYEKMINLRLLIHSEVQLMSRNWLGSRTKRLRSFFSGRHDQPFSKRLRWLSWRGFSSSSIPNSFLSDSLVAIDMCYSNLTQVWDISKCLPKLKILNLAHSHNLKRTLDFSLLPKLEELILSDCTSLSSVHESICTLKFLHTLDISGCFKLTKFPIREFWKMESIKLFRADGTPISYWLNTNYGRVRSSLAIPWPQRLVELSLEKCNLCDDDFPWDISSLSSLKLLNLAGNEITRLPDCIKSLYGLDSLSFEYCVRLETLLELPILSKLLYICGCPSLKKVTFQPALHRVQVMHYRDKSLEIDIECWCKLEPIGSFDEEAINVLGLCDYLEFMKDTYINIISSVSTRSKRLPVQVIREHQGIFNVFLPGSEIPNTYSHKSRESSVSILLPKLPKNEMIQGLNVSTRYAVHQELDDDHYYHESPEISYMMIEVYNSSKGLKWIYAPTFFGYHLDIGEDMIWCCHFKYLGNILEGGDQVTVSIFVGTEFEDNVISFKECGIDVVYGQEEKMGTQLEGTVNDPSDDIRGICDYWEKFMVKPGLYIVKVPFKYRRFSFPSCSMGFPSCLVYDEARSNKKATWPPEHRQHYHVEDGEAVRDEEANDVEEYRQHYYVTDGKAISDEVSDQEEVKYSLLSVHDDWELGLESSIKRRKTS